MNVEIGTEGAKILEKEYIYGIFVAVYLCSGWSAESAQINSKFFQEILDYKYWVVLGKILNSKV